MASAALIKTIKTLQGRAGLDDGDYRALLEARTGKASSRDLDDGAAVRFIEVLRGFAGGPATPARADRATGKYAPVLQALWLSAWHLGIVRSKNDRALLAFVERQTGLSHTRFLVDHAAANRAIEALKGWIKRDAGVEWPADREDVAARKQAVARAVARRLVAEGGFAPFVPGADPWPSDFETYAFRCGGVPAGFPHYEPAHWDRLTELLGGRLRATLAKKRS